MGSLSPEISHIPARLAVLLPHPSDPEVCAIDELTDSLPAMAYRPGETYESQARQLAAATNIDPNQSVNKAYFTNGNVLYVMNQPEHDQLKQGNAWLAYDRDTVKQLLEDQTSAERIAGPYEVRNATFQRSRRALSLYVLTRMLDTSYQNQVLSAFFKDETGHGVLED